MRLITYIFGCLLLLAGFSLKAQERNLFKKKTEIEVKSNSQLFQEKNKKKDQINENITKWCGNVAMKEIYAKLIYYRNLLFPALK